MKNRIAQDEINEMVKKSGLEAKDISYCPNRKSFVWKNHLMITKEGILLDYSGSVI